MKKKIIAFICCLGLAFSAVGCGSKEESTTEVTTVDPNMKPNLTGIKSISELATLETYYHNVAESEKSSGSGLIHLGEKDRKFWLEYEATVELGIDINQVDIEVNGLDVTVTIPDATIMDEKNIKVELIASYFSNDGIFNSNEITTDDQQQAFKEAQDTMITQIKEDKALLNAAKERAKTLIKNYIDKLGSMSGVTYNITWKDQKKDTTEATTEAASE